MTASNANPDSTRRALVLSSLLGGGILLATRNNDPEVALKVPEIMLAEAKSLMAAGAVILDVRSRAAYEARHIAGALLAPLDTLPKLMSGGLAYAKTLPIIVYCGDGSTLGPRGTHELNSGGFARAVNLKPGISGWDAAGLPIERGPGKMA